MINKTITNFRTTLAQSMTATQSTIALSSITTFDGHELSASDLGDTVFLVVEPGAANMEIIKVDATSLEGNTFKNILYRGMPFYGDEEKSVPSNRKGHQAGSVVIISNVHYYYNPLFSFIEQYDGHWEGAAATYSELPPGKNDGEVRVTLDDSKIYVYDLDTTTWNLAGAGGGAGTVYRTTLLGTESTGDDNKTFTLTSGSFPDKKYLQVYKNGVLMSEGATNDYVATGSNQAVFNDAVLDDDVITLLVVSVDIYNPAWNQVNNDVIPDIDNTYDIGSTNKKFKDGHFSGKLTIDEELEVNGIIADLSKHNIYYQFEAGEDIVQNNSVYVADGTTIENIYNHSSVSEGDSFDPYTLKGFGQTFLTSPKTTKITSITFGVRESWGGNSFTGNIKIYATSGGLPTGSPLATQAYSKAGGGATTASATFNLDVSPNTLYAFIVRADTDATASGGTSQTMALKQGNVYANGNHIQTLDNEITFTANASFDYTAVIYTIETVPGKIYKTNATSNNDKANNFIGFAKENINSGTEGGVVIGGVIGGFTGLTIGSTYYLSNSSGDISSSAGSQSRKIGVAISATELLIKQDNN